MGKRVQKTEQSEEHGKSLVPMPRIRRSKTHTHAVYHRESLQGAQRKREGSDKNLSVQLSLGTQDSGEILAFSTALHYFLESSTSENPAGTRQCRPAVPQETESKRKKTN